jgi:hypothetical protein
MPETACEGCGLIVAGGTEGCQALFDAETARGYADTRFAGQHRLVVDVYSLQHPEPYCRSAISLAAHLTGVCVGLEHPGRATELNARIQRWLSSRPVLDKPRLPGSRGRLTVAGVRATTSPLEHRTAVDDWARETWAAYAGLQAIARAWVARVAG